MEGAGLSGKRLEDCSVAISHLTNHHELLGQVQRNHGHVPASWMMVYDQL